jgi:hypothetical protein
MITAASGCRYSGDRSNALRNSAFAFSSTRRREALKPLPARLISKFNMDMADRKGLDLRRWLASADFFKDCAMPRALCPLNTPGCKSSASLRFVTSADHLRGVCDAGFRLVAEVVLRSLALTARFLAGRFCAVRFRVAMMGAPAA